MINKIKNIEDYGKCLYKGLGIKLKWLFRFQMIGEPSGSIYKYIYIYKEKEREYGLISWSSDIFVPNSYW